LVFGEDMSEKSTGFIYLWRKLLDSVDWKCSTPEQKVILITLLTMANHKENKWEWHGKEFGVKPGQFVTSLASIRKAAGLGISQQNVRTAIARFKKLKFLTNHSTNRGRLITIINWARYQNKETHANIEANKQLTSTSQAANKQLTPNNNVNNDNNDIILSSESKISNLGGEKTEKKIDACDEEWKKRNLPDNNGKPHLVPDNFEYSFEMEMYAREKGIVLEKVPAFFQSFMNWAKASGKKCVDWDAQFLLYADNAPTYGKQYMQK
jgi:hypothetical protein